MKAFKQSPSSTLGGEDSLIQNVNNREETQRAEELLTIFPAAKTLLRLAISNDDDDQQSKHDSYLSTSNKKRGDFPDLNQLSVWEKCDVIMVPSDLHVDCNMRTWIDTCMRTAELGSDFYIWKATYWIILIRD